MKRKKNKGRRILKKGFRQLPKKSDEEKKRRKNIIYKALEISPDIRIYVEKNNTDTIKAFLQLYYAQIEGRKPPGMAIIFTALELVKEEMEAPIKEKEEATA